MKWIAKMKSEIEPLSFDAWLILEGVKACESLAIEGAADEELEALPKRQLN